MTSDSSTTGKAAELTLAGLFEGLRDSYIKLAKQYRVDIKANFGEDVLELIEETWRKSEALATKDAETKHRIEEAVKKLDEAQNEIVFIGHPKIAVRREKASRLVSEAQDLLTKPADGEDA